MTTNDAKLVWLKYLEAAQIIMLLVWYNLERHTEFNYPSLFTNILG